MINVPEKVKQALRDGRLKKNYRFVVYDNDSSVIKYTINNENLVKESVKIDERMVTGNELKFGLCEGSVLEFQYFGLNNIRECRIQAFIYVQCQGDSDDVSDWISIPMGWYDVKECPMQASTGIFKVTAVNKLKSDYLDKKLNDEITLIVQNGEDGVPNEITIFKLLDILLKGFSINTAKETLITSHPALIFQNVYPIGFGQSTYTIYNSSGASTGRKCAFYFAHINVLYTMNLSDYYRCEIGWLKAVRDYILALPSSPSGYVWNTSHTAYRSLASTMTMSDDDLRGWSDYEGNRGHFFLHDRATLGEYNIPICPYNSDEIFDTDYHRNWLNPIITVPLHFATGATVPNISNSQEIQDIVTARANEVINIINHYLFNIYFLELNNSEKMILTYSQIQSITEDLTLRELQSAVYEQQCQYGKLDRETDLFSGIELNNSRLLPADNLYPANSLYPSGTSEHPMPSQYSKLWTDSAGVQKFRYLIITYKGLEGEQGQEQEVEKTLQRTVNNDGNVDYNMSDNWLFRNLIWTDEDVGDYADAMVAKMRDIRWFPFEMWGAGLPYLETGDEIEITVGDETNRSYILTRQLKGIHNLQDQYINGTLDIF